MSLTSTTQRVSVPNFPVQTVLAATAGGLLTAGFLADLAYLGMGDAAWISNAAWLLLAGSIASGLLVMTAFLSAVCQRGEGQRRGWVELLGYCAVWGMSVASAVFHSHGVAGFQMGLMVAGLVAALVMAKGRVHRQATAMLDR